MWIVNLAGLVLIGLIVWWFWLYRPAEVELGESEKVIIVENGVYSPSHIKLKADQAATLTFLRKDASPCAEMVVIPALEFSATLPVGKEKTVQLPAMKQGDYDFHCQMKMYRGQLKVE